MPASLYPFIKRGIDIFASASGLLVSAPLLGALAVAIKLGDGGPVLYRGERVGLGQCRFRMLKFRTMSVNAERTGVSSTSADDPRVTEIGVFLRRYKLDELPQLINVLNGEMSLVGPRPQVPWAVDRYTLDEQRLLSVRPGITDYASVRFRDEGDILRGSSNPDRDYLEKIAPEKIRLGLVYVDTRSLVVDCCLIAATVWAFLGRDTAWLFKLERKRREIDQTGSRYR